MQDADFVLRAKENGGHQEYVGMKNKNENVEMVPYWRESFVKKNYLSWEGPKSGLEGDTEAEIKKIFRGYN